MRPRLSLSETYNINNNCNFVKYYLDRITIIIDIAHIDDERGKFMQGRQG